MPSSHSSFVFAASVMFLTGIGIPVMAALNAGLGRGLGSPTAATAALFGAGLAFSLLALAWTGLPKSADLAGIAPQSWFGAIFVVSYVLAVTYFAPRIGVGNAVFFVLVGQLVAAAVIDHFALLGALKTPLTARRAIGLALMALGVWLAKKPA